MAFGLCFQLPVLLTLMGKAGLVSSEGLAKVRKYAIVGILVLAGSGHAARCHHAGDPVHGASTAFMKSRSSWCAASRKSATRTCGKKGMLDEERSTLVT